MRQYGTRRYGHRAPDVAARGADQPVERDSLAAANEAYDALKTGKRCTRCKQDPCVMDPGCVPGSTWGDRPPAPPAERRYAQEQVDAVVAALRGQIAEVERRVAALESERADLETTLRVIRKYEVVEATATVGDETIKLEVRV